MSVVDDIKARLDIVDIVSDRVTLKKAGRNFKANCPFHTEKTPSFVVNPVRQSWHCFGGCATGGDVFTFIMRAEGVEFGEALRILAQKTGVELSRRRDGAQNDTNYEINKAAARFYRDHLESKGGQAGIKYLAERGVDADAIAKFELGLSPNTRDALKSHLRQLDYDIDQCVQAGVFYRDEDGNTRDFFWGRLMFPIHDRQGRIAGFGARSLDGSNPKYLNTPATPIFDKRNTLYALHLAAESIRSQGTGIIVEGYMDAIAAHQFGYNNVVASMGTALTEQQVNQLKSMARNFVLALDPDAAGQEATLRSLEASWRVFDGQRVDDQRRSVGVLYQREPLSLKIAALPAGRDPDVLIREDAKEWERLTQNAVPFLDFSISAIASRYDLSTAQGKNQAAQILKPLLTSVDPIEQDHYLQIGARALNTSVEALKASIGGTTRGRRQQRRQVPENRPVDQVTGSAVVDEAEESLEKYVLALLLNRPELKKSTSGFEPEYFHRSEYREVFTRWLDCTTIDDLWDLLDESLHQPVQKLVEQELVPAERYVSEIALEQCLQRLAIRHEKELLAVLLDSEDASVPPPRELEAEVATVNARLKELFAQKIR